MRGITDYNFPAFMKAAEELRRMGYEVFNPAEEDLKEWKTMQRVIEEATLRFCLKKDLMYILDHAEGIALLPGWEKSKGVAVELTLAKALGLVEIYL